MLKPVDQQLRELLGYNDRVSGLPPQSTDIDYFRGYADRIGHELRNELALAESSKARQACETLLSA